MTDNQIMLQAVGSYMKPNAADAQEAADRFTRRPFQSNWGELRKLIYILMLHGY